MISTAPGSGRRGTDTSGRWVIALVLLTIVAAVALRGFVPGAPPRPTPGPREPQPDNPASLVAVLVLLFAAIGIVLLAVLGRARRRAPAPAAGSRPDWLRRESARPTWRAALIAFAAVAVWLALAAWLNRWRVDAPVPETTLPDRSSETFSGTSPPVDVVSSDDAGPDPLGYFTVATVAFLVVLVVGTLVARRRAPIVGVSDAARPPGPAPTTRDPSQNLARAAELALAEVEDPDREPRKAIIACYAAMERELARTPDAAPRDFDTASEVLARAVDHHAVRPGTATRLVDLFDEARFSPHVMNEGHREVAVGVLTEVLAEMRGRP